MGLIRDLGDAKVALDTAVFIYFIEDHPKYVPIVLPLFEQVARGERIVSTSALTLLEVLVVPLRSGDRALADRYETLLTRSRGVQLIDLSLDQLRAAAHVRAATGIKTPDALQIVAALSAGCTAFVTNDRRLPKLPGLRALELDSYLK